MTTPALSKNPDPAMVVDRCARCQSSVEVRQTQIGVTTLCAGCSALADVAAFLIAEQQWRLLDLRRADAARRRFELRNRRLQREETERSERLAARMAITPISTDVMPDAIRAALERAAKRNPR